MVLSYTFRLLCLLTVVTGAVMVALELLLAVGDRSILNRLEAVSARRRERILYLLQMAPLLAAIFVAGALCLPEYLRYEPTGAIEPVGWFSLLLAASVGLWFGFALLRGARVTLRTLRFIRTCRRSGRVLQHLTSDTPVLVLTEPNPPVGLAGFLHPVILISAALLEDDGLRSRALAVALEHERSHAHHRDNWKLLSLSFLPRLQGLFSLSDRLHLQWQKSADWAADDDAVRGDPARSLLLAEALVRTARLVRTPGPSVLCAALTSAEAGLALRVDRLLRPRPDFRSAETSLPLRLGALVVLALGAALVASPWMYSLLEQLLHLGGF
jgi:hypothetical protein